jgi:hypothetical protein
LWKTLRRVARPEQPLDLLKAVWPVMVGTRLAAHTRPLAWSRGRVRIGVDDPEWERQLSSLTEDIRRQINRWWGTGLVQEVVLVREKPRGKGRAASEKKSAASPAAAGAESREPATSRAAESKLRKAIQEIEPALRGISDEDLRDLLARVTSRYLGGRQKK